MDALRKSGAFWTCVERRSIPKCDFRYTFGQDTATLLLDKGIMTGDFASYQFTFVGVISVRRNIIVVFPKVFNIKDIDAVLIRNLVSTLKKYANSNKLSQDAVDFFSFDPLEQSASELALADFIIKDFQINGLFIRSISTKRDAGIGETSWGDTIAHQHPFFSRGTPFYNETINVHIEIQQNYIITEIHKWAIGYSLNYSALLAEEIQQLPFEYIPNLEDLGSPEKLISLINIELNETFSDRGLRLLQCFRFLISRYYDLDIEGFSLFGTLRFEYVWEDICMQIFNSQKKEILSKIKDKLTYPLWQFFDSPTVEGDLSIRPDIIIIDEVNNILYILDAKYYNLQWPLIQGAPEGASILKQFFYDTYFSNTTGVASVFNAFLLPVGQQQYQLLAKQPKAYVDGPIILAGNVQLEFYKDKRVEVIFVSLQIALQHYINRTKLNGVLDRMNQRQI